MKFKKPDKLVQWKKPYKKESSDPLKEVRELFFGKYRDESSVAASPPPQNSREIPRTKNVVVQVTTALSNEYVDKLVDDMAEIRKQLFLLNSRRMRLENELVRVSPSHLIYTKKGNKCQIVKTTESKFNLAFFIEVMGLKAAHRWMKETPVTQVMVTTAEEEHIKAENTKKLLGTK